ncbi:unnamed protein product [Bemisia tabaci]|uniref:Uncharacterized protein n=1 Tax=Bemisia tabaci TaxID=7038 RepID=A0A9P0F315_BEMTA|nr:unnamed protein product [Bemisia tabaci]
MVGHVQRMADDMLPQKLSSGLRIFSRRNGLFAISGLGMSKRPPTGLTKADVWKPLIKAEPRTQRRSFSDGVSSRRFVIIFRLSLDFRAKNYVSNGSVGGLGTPAAESASWPMFCLHEPFHEICPREKSHLRSFFPVPSMSSSSSQPSASAGSNRNVLLKNEAIRMGSFHSSSNVGRPGPGPMSGVVSQNCQLSATAAVAAATGSTAPPPGRIKALGPARCIHLHGTPKSIVNENCVCSFVSRRESVKRLTLSEFPPPISGSSRGKLVRYTLRRRYYRDFTTSSRVIDTLRFL